MRSRSRQDKSLITLIRSFGRHSLPTSRVDTMAQSMVPQFKFVPTNAGSPNVGGITVTFSYDPSLSDSWPRPEKEWKGKEFVLSASPPPFPVKVYKLDAMKKWAPAGVSFIGPAEENWTPNLSYSMGIEENATDPGNPRKIWQLIPM